MLIYYFLSQKLLVWTDLPPSNLVDLLDRCNSVSTPGPRVISVYDDLHAVVDVLDGERCVVTCMPHEAEYLSIAEVYLVAEYLVDAGGNHIPTGNRWYAQLVIK